MSVNSDAVVIEPYNAAWPAMYASEQHLLVQVFGPKVRIEHVGSTAVEGLGAKPTIDIMAGLPELDVLKGHMPGLAALGYAYMPEYERLVPERRFFRKPESGERKYHLHCVCIDSEFFKDHLVFRDYLRDHPPVAKEYERLKHKVLAEVGGDRAAYTEGKTSFIEGVLGHASHIELE